MAEKIATREAYGNALAEFGSEYDFVVLDADLAAATKTGIFKKKFPERFFDCGIAEGNMMCVAAGLAAAGKTVFASSFAMFAAGRAFEPIRNAIGYPHLNVKIGATHAGITVGDAHHSRYDGNQPRRRRGGKSGGKSRYPAKRSDVSPLRQTCRSGDLRQGQLPL